MFRNNMHMVWWQL